MLGKTRKDMAPQLDLRMLAYGLLDDKNMLSMVTAVIEEYFHPDCRVMWKLIAGCYRKYKQVPIERTLRQVAGDAWQNGLADLYKHITDTGVDPREYPVDLEEMKGRFNEQLLRRAGKTVFQENFNGSNFSDIDGANKAVRDLVADIDRLHATEVFREGSLAGTAEDSWREYLRIKDNPELAAGVHLGFDELDRITNGLRPSELLLIGGESGTGKSALTMNMCVNAWLGKNKVPVSPSQPMPAFTPGRSVVYFTIEMPFEALLRRLHACVAGIPLHGIRDGTLTDEEMGRYRAALRFIREYPHPFYVVDIPRGASMRHVEVKYLELCQTYPDNPPDLLGLDYISLMTPDRDEGSDWLNVGRLAEQLHEFGRVHNIASISPVQLNRAPRKDLGFARPDQDRIGRSAMLTQNANIVLTIEKRKDEHLQRDMRVHIIKMRDGEQSLMVFQKRLDIMRLYDSMPGWTPTVYDGTDGTVDAT